MKPPFYVASNGRLLLHLEPAEEGSYVVTSPYDSAIITEAESLEEAFEMAEDVVKTLEQVRKKLKRRRISRRKTNSGRASRR
jgi:antitoxin HicB